MMPRTDIGTTLAVSVLAFAIPLAVLPPASLAESSKQELAICWSPEMLAARPRDHEIQRGIRSAFVAAPKRTPISAGPVAPGQRLAIRRVRLPPGVKLVALTFDLCEQSHEIAGYQGGIVDYLRKEKVKATFFAGGKWMMTHRERTQQLMSDPLFEMGNHTWTHRNLRLLRGSALASEIGSTQLAYEQVREELTARQCLGLDGRRPADQSAAIRLSLFRFPFGACDVQSLEAVGEAGLRAIQWDVSSGDPWPGQTAQRMAKAVLDSVTPGSIVLFHANGRGWHTPTAIRAIVAVLRAKGYGFVTVSELLASGEPVYSATCYDSRPGDTDRYDGLARRLETLHPPAQQKVLSSPPKAASDFTIKVYKAP
jgi:peptidoglycan-N-acetylglucosamine deacetylase